LIYTYTCVNLKQIPADMVVNAMLVAMVTHANQPCDDSIYHVGSSVGNPVRYESLRDYSYRYFTAKPCYDKEGKAIKVGKVTVLENMNSFQRYMYIRYLLPLKVIQFLFLSGSLVARIHLIRWISRASGVWTLAPAYNIALSYQLSYAHMLFNF